MHIEPGFVTPAKVMLANGTALGILAFRGRSLITEPDIFVKTLIAACFFTLFMQSFHRPIGPSELHFIGASALYLTLGFVPTLIGFAVGLLFQGLLFAPTDLYHLGVNALSLMLPLMGVHAAMGRKLFDQSARQRVRWSTILKLDAVYYGGVTAMVGFWLLMSGVATPFSAWLTWASSYLIVVVLEPFVTYGILKGLQTMKENPRITRFSIAHRLNVS